MPTTTLTKPAVTDTTVQVTKPVALTEVHIANAKAKAARYEIKDAVVPGLRLVVQTSGAKSWALRYSYLGNYRKFTIGSWPQIPLAESAEDKKARLARDPRSEAPDARGIARAKLALLAMGVDPATEKKEQRATVATDRADADKHLVRVQWQKYLDHSDMKPSSRQKVERVFGHVLPTWGNKPLSKITLEDCNDAIDARREAGPHAANAMFTVLQAFFNWAVKRGALVASPVRTLEKPHKETPRERVLTDAELRTIWNGADQVPVYGAMIQLAMLTGQRRSECASMRFSSIEFAAKEWHLKGDDVKNEAPHVVHLSDAALRIIENAKRFENCDYVFTTDGKNHISGFSKFKKKLDKVAPVAGWTTHDTRRTLSTRLAKAGVPLQVSEKILNHGKGTTGGIVGVYNKYSYFDERRAALTAWAVMLERIVDAHKASNVVPMVLA